MERGHQFITAKFRIHRLTACMQTLVPLHKLSTQPVAFPFLPRQDDALFLFQDLAPFQQFPWSLPSCQNQNGFYFPLWFSITLYLFLLELVFYPVIGMVFCFPTDFLSQIVSSRYLFIYLFILYISTIRYIEFSSNFFDKIWWIE